MNKTVKLTDLTPDDRNFNLGTEDGARLIRKSLSKLGAGRSILIDKHDRIIAGNKTAQEAAKLGMEDVIVVEADGSKLIAVQRTDIDLNSKKGRELALADNVATERNLLFSHETIFAESTKHGFDIETWGLSSKEFKPKLEPKASTGQVTEDKIKTTEDKLASRFEFEEKDSRDVECPRCGKRFTIGG